MVPDLMSPVKVGNLQLRNRVFMAPLTRLRASPDHVPTDLMVEYYAQRATAGLIIAECALVSPDAHSSPTEPGVYTAEMLAGWRRVTDAVHARGGRVFLQIWHPGRAAHPDYNGGRQPVAPSAVAIEPFAHARTGKRHAVPRALAVAEIAAIVDSFVRAASDAITIANFDGVEIHAANGYLIDQFLRDGSNFRKDDYGGSIHNRLRLLSQILSGTVEKIGAEKVGARFSPINSANSVVDSDPFGLSEEIAKLCQSFNLAYVHVVRRDFLRKQVGNVVPIFRKYFQNTLIGNMGYNKEEANQQIAAGLVDAVAFGKFFIANPDLPRRFEQGAELSVPDPSTFSIGGVKGYTDYPVWSE
ncbi:hypothetical protein HDU84_008203 [Entophlyctis sp. JEL0112]|nr:hypothetical protein HDU84_008203 [Entophlyctis sp. JEL0112]